LIDRLVGDVVADNQLDECDITIREIHTVKESFFKVIRGIYHHRIDYPGYNFKLPVTSAQGASDRPEFDEKLQATSDKENLIE
jgi:hypothetical protein